MHNLLQTSERSEHARVSTDFLDEWYSSIRIG
jgi:hypothetical protein